MPNSFNRQQNFDFKEKPYGFLGISGCLLIILSLLPLSINTGAVDINLHDTYFVIAHSNLLAILGIVLLFLWSLYLMSHKILLSKALTWFHVTFTILSILAFLFIARLEPEPRRYYSFTDEASTFDWVTAVMIVVACFSLAQLIFLVNLVSDGIYYFLFRIK